jgi:alkanesulfonate monooxygenase SsuD/methylene tetrahydromethanopterin reductase-like flavin-dependent oxidoreductase (luciferase family)
VWVSTTSPGGAARVGARGFVQATFLTGFDGTRAVFDAYRKGWREAGRGNDVPLDRLSYAALVYVGRSDAEARAGAEKLLWYNTANKIAPQFANPPGYVPVPTVVKALRGAMAPGSNFPKSVDVDSAIERGIMFAGTPDTVYGQIKRMYDHVGGFGNLLIMGQAGFLDHDETVLGIRNFAREVYPRLKAELTAPPAAAARAS